MNSNYENEMKELESFFNSKKVKLDWDFSSLKSWVNSSNIDESKKNSINVLTERMIQLVYQ